MRLMSCATVSSSNIRFVQQPQVSLEQIRLSQGQAPFNLIGRLTDHRLIQPGQDARLKRYSRPSA